MTITQTTSRFGDPLWVVQWGRGLTETIICRTEAEAVAVAAAPLAQRHAIKGSVEPLVSFRTNYQ